MKFWVIFFVLGCQPIETTKIFKDIKKKIRLVRKELIKTSPVEKFEESLSEKDKAFHVTSVEGEIYYWTPLGNRWHLLRAGESLKIGCMMQVSEGAKMRINFKAKDQPGWEAETIYLNINEPMNVRLDEDMMRAIQSDSKYFRNVPEAESESKGDVEKEQRRFQSAWNRIASVIENSPKNKEEIAKLFSKSQESMEVGVRSKNLKIFDPPHGGARYVEDYPTTLTVYWEDVAKESVRYKVYFWAQNDYKSEAFAITNQPTYSIPVQAPGSYYIQISTEDKIYLSKANLVHFNNPQARLSEADSLESLNEIKLIYPQDQSLVFLKPQSKQYFSWKLPKRHTLKNLELYYEAIEKSGTSLVQASTSKKNSVKSATDSTTPRVQKIQLTIEESYASVMLPQGSFYWWIEGVAENPANKDEKNKKIKSPHRLITVMPPTKDWEKMTSYLESSLFRSVYVGSPTY